MRQLFGLMVMPATVEQVLYVSFNPFSPGVFFTKQVNTS